MQSTTTTNNTEHQDITRIITNVLTNRQTLWELFILVQTWIGVVVTINLGFYLLVPVDENNDNVLSILVLFFSFWVAHKATSYLNQLFRSQQDNIKE